MFKIEVALIAGVTHKHPGLLQADGRGKKNKHEHVTGYHYCYHYWCVFLLEAFPQRGSDFSTLGCGNASNVMTRNRSQLGHKFQVLQHPLAGHLPEETQSWLLMG